MIRSFPQFALDWTGVKNRQTLSDGQRPDIGGANAFPVVDNIEAVRLEVSPKKI